MARAWLSLLSALVIPGISGCTDDSTKTTEHREPPVRPEGAKPPVVDRSRETVVFEEIAPREPHPFSIKDILEFATVGVPVASPEGSLIAFGLKRTDWSDNRSREDLWVVEVEAGRARRLTLGAENESEPVWSSDGQTIYYLAKGERQRAVWSIPAAGGEAAKVIETPLDIEHLRLSPDGKTLAFSAEVFPDCRDLACTAERLEERERNAATGHVHDRLFVRHWDEWEDGRRSHVFVVPVRGGEPVDLTTGLDGDVPSEPFGDRDEFIFTPDGEALIFTARLAGLEEPWSTNFDLFQVPISGGEPKNLTENNEAWDTGPVFSPDGATFVYRAMERAGFEADRFRIMVKSWPDGEARELAPKWDRSADELLFANDGTRLFVVAQDKGQTALFAVRIDDGTVEPVVSEGTVTGIARAGDRVVFRKNDLRAPNELFVMDADGDNLRPLTKLNERALALADRGEAEQFSFKGAKGDTVYGYVVKPVGFDANQSYPVAFLIHGGPQGSFGNQFHRRWNPQTYAGAGYATVMIDFHGSEGYGQRFTDAVSGDWGGAPLEDLKKGLSAALKQYPWLDGDKVCALGASYGGYMINWIAGKWPDRFRCLVNHDGVFDQRSMYYSTEELWFPEWEHGGPYYGAASNYERHNPVDLVSRWKAPMLVIHGGLDFRVPLEQGLATFTALQRRKIPSRFLYFPDENHWVLAPANSVQWHETVLAWLDRWLRSEADPQSTKDAGGEPPKSVDPG